MTNNTKTPNVGKQDWEKKVKKIAEAIGSPYGEGATYTRGSSPSHLDVSDKAELIEDILKLLTQQEEELRRKLIKEIGTVFDNYFRGLWIIPFPQSTKITLKNAVISKLKGKKV